MTGLGLNFGGPGPNFPRGGPTPRWSSRTPPRYLVRNHTFKFGGEFRRFLNENFSSDTGTFNFGSLADFQSGVGNNFAVTLGDRPSKVRAQAVGCLCAGLPTGPLPI